jgi:PadR family transcriptional regulator, regulatory protein PadR
MMYRPPMHETSFFILLSLSGGPKHGYGIQREVSELSGGQIALGAGTLYGALERFLEDGVIELAEESVENGRPRRTYRLTGRGSEQLKEQFARREAILKVARRRLFPRGAV